MRVGYEEPDETGPSAAKYGVMFAIAVVINGFIGFALAGTTTGVSALMVGLFVLVANCIVLFAGIKRFVREIITDRERGSDVVDDTRSTTPREP
jgi:hypothetical protein